MFGVLDFFWSGVKVGFILKGKEIELRRGELVCLRFYNLVENRFSIRI